MILLGAFGNGGIQRVAVGDRTPVAITKIDTSLVGQDTWPAFLPDGHRFLFTRSTPDAGVATYIGTLAGDAPKKIVDGSRRIFVPSTGSRSPYLLGIDDPGLVAQPFDLNTLSVTGAAATLVAGATSVSASANGVLASSAVGNRPRTIPTWFDHKGTSLGVVGDAGLIEGVALSPDGRKLAVSESRSVPGRQVSTIWLRDLVSGARTRVTFGESDGTPVWSPTFSNGAPAALFDAPVQAGYTSDSHRWQVAPDGKRFLLLLNDGKDQAPPLEVVVNWPVLLRR